jgi:hypothetical protein
MPTILKTKNSVTTTVAPTTLQQGELAVNITDKKLWVGNAATTPVQLLGAGTTGTAAGSNTQVQYNSSGTLAGDADFTFNGTTVTMANDASISGLTVGKGGGSQVTNTALGSAALAGTNTGGYTTGVGLSALQSNTSGRNTAFGALAAAQTTTGTLNTSIGDSSLYNNTTGGYNVAVGQSSLQSNTTASNNTAVGYQAGYSNTTGTENTALGRLALYTNTTADGNTALGTTALYLNSTGTQNTATGRSALLSNTTGSNNAAFGVQALNSNTTASANTAVGYRSGFANTTGTLTAFGNNALSSNTTGVRNIAFGSAAAVSTTTGTDNVAIGYDALFTNSTANSSTAVGGASLTNATGASNTAIGYFAGNAITSGSKNTILGSYSGNQGGLDIRTASNNIVLSDGDGNPRIWNDSNNYTYFAGFTAFPGAANTANGFMVENSGSIYVSRAAGYPVSINRNSDDGVLVRLGQAGTEEGSISVSGTTVSFNGGHLSRWSQLPDGSKDESIVKGTVLTNLDDMCVWEKDGVVADNEQLNKMKVSDVEGDTNVAGVFVNWTMDEEYGVDDMNVAMTGDMIIRIADGVVVQKGDLLMSAGDGTAKPQGDDIVRSKTVAKVTSNYVTCTYADGSYCVPCVLMAC